MHTYVFLASNEMTLPSSGYGIVRMNLLTEMVKFLTVLTEMNYKQNQRWEVICVRGFVFYNSVIICNSEFTLF
jgi:hypothetical protein